MAVHYFRGCGGRYIGFHRFGVEVFVDPEGYRTRLIVKGIGIFVTMLGFCVQAWGILLQLLART